MQIVVHSHGYYEEETAVRGCDQNKLQYVAIGAACVAAVACLSFVNPASSFYTTARPVKIVQAFTQGTSPSITMRQPQIVLSSSNEKMVTPEALPEMQPTFAPTSSHWALAALSAVIAPVAYLYKRWSATEDFEDDDDEDLEQEAEWVLAAAAGKVILQQTAVVPIKDASGANVGSTELCLRTAGINSRHVIHRKLVAELANRRQANAHTKTRGEVSGGGKKPYKQKGTGNARRGSNRSPLMRKGGVAFGPRNTKNYKQKINKKEGRLAISSLIQNRAPLITVIRDMEGSMDAISTKKASDMVNSWCDPAKGKKVLMLINVEGNWPAEHPLVKSTDNIPSVRLMSQQKVSVVDLLWPHQIFISESALEGLKQRFEVPFEDGETSA